MARRKQPTIPDALLDQLLAGADAKSAFDPNGLLDELKKALAERALNAEMDHHLAGENGTGTAATATGRRRSSPTRAGSSSMSRGTVSRVSTRS